MHGGSGNDFMAGDAAGNIEAGADYPIYGGNDLLRGADGNDTMSAMPTTSW